MTVCVSRLARIVAALAAAGGLLLGSGSPSVSALGLAAHETRGHASSRGVTKLLVVIEENQSLSQMQAHMPYAYSLAQRFSYATNYHAITHPSPRPGRPVVGDVRGKGLTAVEQAARVIRAFRQAAATGTSLPDVAADMDAYLIPFMGDEDFATALLVDASHRGRVTFLSCGHPPPMMSGPTEPPSSSPCQPGCRWVWGPAASRSRCRGEPAIACCCTPTASAKPVTNTGSSCLCSSWHRP
jgi:hypothetical protein